MDLRFKNLEQDIDSSIRELPPDGGDNEKFHALKLAKTRFFMCAEEVGIQTSQSSAEVVAEVIRTVSAAFPRETSKRSRLFGAMNSRNGKRTQDMTAALQKGIHRLEGLLGEEQRNRYKERYRSYGWQKLASKETTEIEALIDTLTAMQDSDSGDVELEQLARVRKHLLNATKHKDVHTLSDQIGRQPYQFHGPSSTSLDYDGAKPQALATYRHGDGSSKTVYVEAKQIMTGTDRDARRGQMQRLAGVLNSKFAADLMRVLPCLGTVEITSHDPLKPLFCAIYDMPSTRNVASRSLPFTLHGLLTEAGFRPSLSKRIKLALELATGLMYLLAVGWRHKEIRSANVMMFGASLSRRDLDEPKFVGLTYARDGEYGVSVSDRPEELYDLWRHPHYGPSNDRDRKFLPEYDVYSLGLVLFEVGCWKALDELFKDMRRQAGNAVTMKTIGNTLVSRDADLSCRGELEYRAGDAYAKVVEACMDPKLKGMGTEQLVSHVRDEVVLKLERCLECMD